MGTVSLGELAEEAPRSLVGRCVAGELSAWRDLHRQYYPVAAAFLRKLGLREAELDDACQEVFLQMFRHLGQYRGEAELKTWMYRICASQASRHFRKTRGLLRLLDRFRQDQMDDATLPSDVAAIDSRRTLERAMARMSERERLVFVLFELEGIAGAEVAVIAECPVNTVWRRLHDARQKLREVLEPEGERRPS